MKKMIKNLMLVAVAAMAFVACSQEGNEVNISTKKTAFEFTASFDAETRSSFDGLNENGDAYKSVWNGGEMVRLIARDGEGKFIEATYPYVELIGDDNTTARISGEFNQDLTNVATIEAYVGGWYHDTEYSYMNLNIYQTPTDDSVDTYVHTLKATADWDGVSAAKLHFQHAASYGRMTLTQFDSLAGGEVVVSFTTPDSSYSYTMYADKLTNNVVWFACDAFEVTAFTVKAKVGGKTYSKEITGVNRALYFETGKVTEFTVKDLQEEVAATIVSAKATVGTLSNSTDNKYRTVSFTLSNNDVIALEMRTEGNNWLVLGEYTDSYSNYENGYYPGYVNYAYLNGISIGWAYTSVSYENDAYTIQFRVTQDWTNFIEYTYTGAIEGLDAPIAGGGDEPGTGEGGDTGVDCTFTSASKNAMSGYSTLTFSNGTNTFFSEFNHSGISPDGAAVVAGTYTFTTAFNYANYDATGTTCDDVAPTSGTIDVVDNGDGTWTFTMDFIVKGNPYKGTYTGTL